MNTTHQSNNVLDRLPTPHEVRTRLADSLQEVQFLKQLLKLSVERERYERPTQQEGQMDA